MKLSQDEVARIVRKLTTEWAGSKLAVFKQPEDVSRNGLMEIFTHELRVEDDLNAEVEKMLSKYEKEFQSGKLDRRKMFLMIKNQLVKERKIVL